MSAPESRWEDLLAIALPALDHVFGPMDPARRPGWTLGGGTAIAIRIGHRISFDIDIFVPGVPLKLLVSPRNPHARAISTRVQWPGHYQKYERPEGEIDFLSPPLQTEPGFTWHEFRGRPIALETLEEVVVKKIRYRSAGLTPRDAFDIAAVAQCSPGLANVLAAEVPDALARALESLDRHASRGVDPLAAAIRVTESGERLMPEAYAIAGSVLRQAASIA